MLDVHLRPVDEASASQGHMLDAEPEVAPVGDVEDRSGIRGNGARLTLRTRQRRRCQYSAHQRPELAPGQSCLHSRLLAGAILPPAQQAESPCTPASTSGCGGVLTGV